MNPKEKKTYTVNTAHVNVPKSKMVTNFEWIESNTELMFKERLNTDSVITPTKMKIKNLCQSNNSEGKDLSLNINLKNENNKANNSSQTMYEVKKMLQEKFGNNHKY